MPHYHVVKLTLGLGGKNNMVRVRKPYTFVTYGTVRYDGQLKTKLLLTLAHKWDTNPWYPEGKSHE